MRIVYTCPELALSVSLWSSCGKEWTERYRGDASFSTLLFSRTTQLRAPQQPAHQLIRQRLLGHRSPWSLAALGLQEGLRFDAGQALQRHDGREYAPAFLARGA